MARPLSKEEQGGVAFKKAEPIRIWPSVAIYRGRKKEPVIEVRVNGEF